MLIEVYLMMILILILFSGCTIHVSNSSSSIAYRLMKLKAGVLTFDGCMLFQLGKYKNASWNHPACVPLINHALS